MVFKYKSIKDFFFPAISPSSVQKWKPTPHQQQQTQLRVGSSCRGCAPKGSPICTCTISLLSGTWSSLVFWSLTRRHCYVGIWTAHRFTQTILNLLSFSHQEVRSLWNLFTSKQWECLLISLSGDPATLHEQMNLLLNQISGQQMPVLAPCSKTSQPKPCTTIYSLIFITNP